MQGVKILPVHKGKGKRGVSAHGRNPVGSCRHKNKKCSSRGKRQERPPDLTYLKSISRERPGRGGLQVLCLGGFILQITGASFIPCPAASSIPFPFSSSHPSFHCCALQSVLFYFPWSFQLQCCWKVLLPWYSCSPRPCYVCISYYLNNKFLITSSHVAVSCLAVLQMTLFLLPGRCNVCSWMQNFNSKIELWIN